mgnify:FL=1
MATKLKNLHVKKVDFVDEGANQKADIKVLKNKDGKTEPPETGIGMFEKIMKWILGQGGSTQSVAEDVAKAATMFNEQINAASMEEIREEIWSVCYALQTSLNSILCDAEMDSTGKQSAMETSMEQFTEAMKGYIPTWVSGTPASIKKGMEEPDEDDLPMIEKAHEKLEELINKTKKKGELEEMLKIDKSKMSAEERAAYDDLIKKFAVETNEEPPIEKKAPPENKPDVIDDGGATTKTDTMKSLVPPAGNSDEDIYKGLHPIVKARLEALEKSVAETEERELFSVAKKYETIGEKPEELVKTLKTLKDAGGTAYNDMIKILDRSLGAVEKSGVFGEIGKSFSGGPITSVKKSAAEAKIDTIAKGYIDKDPKLTYESAVAKAWEANPELMAEYENEAGF